MFRGRPSLGGEVVYDWAEMQCIRGVMAKALSAPAVVTADASCVENHELSLITGLCG